MPKIIIVSIQYHPDELPAIIMFLPHEAYAASTSRESISTADYTYALKPCSLTTVSSNVTALLNIFSIENIIENLGTTS